MNRKAKTARAVKVKKTVSKLKDGETNSQGNDTAKVASKRVSKPVQKKKVPAKPKAAAKSRAVKPKPVEESAPAEPKPAVKPVKPKVAKPRSVKPKAAKARSGKPKKTVAKRSKSAKSRA